MIFFPPGGETFISFDLGWARSPPLNDPKIKEVAVAVMGQCVSLHTAGEENRKSSHICHLTAQFSK